MARLIKVKVLPQTGEDFCWDEAQADELVGLYRAYRESVVKQAADTCAKARSKYKGQVRVRREGRITPADLAGMVDREVTTIYNWLKKKTVIDPMDECGTWDASKKDRLLAQVAAHKRAVAVAHKKRPSRFKKVQEAGGDLRPALSPAADLALARQQLEMLMEDLDGDFEKAMKLAESWSGVTVRWASGAAFEKLRRERMVERAIRRDPSTGTIRRLDQHYDLGPSSNAAKTFKRVTGIGVRELRASMAKPVTADDLADA